MCLLLELSRSHLSLSLSRSLSLSLSLSRGKSLRVRFSSEVALPMLCSFALKSFQMLVKRQYLVFHLNILHNMVRNFVSTEEYKRIKTDLFVFLDTPRTFLVDL